MQREERMSAEQYLLKKRRKSIWQRIVIALACVVVFCTTYALILPAITQERDVFCGLEAHTHTEDCYTQLPEAEVIQQICAPEVHTHSDSCLDEEGVVICGQLDYVAHIHNELCVDADGNLHCTLEERETHVHTDACWQTVETVVPAEIHSHTEACITVQRGELVCELPESEEHSHVDACYEQLQTLACGLEEGAVISEESVQTETVLVCTEVVAQDHVHEEACFQTVIPEAGLTCELEENDAHTHSKLCYGTWILSCEMAEHVHSLACYADLTADVETAEDWEKTFENLELTGAWAEDVLALAQSQLGYQESTKNYVVMEDGVSTRGYTRYGAWYGDPYGDWCAMFASFCLDYAGVEDMPLESNCPNWIEKLTETDAYQVSIFNTLKDESSEQDENAEASDEEIPDTTESTGQDEDADSVQEMDPLLLDYYVPKAGDLIFFDWDDNGNADHVGFVSQVEPHEETEILQITTIEGNSGNRVQSKSYAVNDVTILGYGDLEPFYIQYLKEKNEYCYCGLDEHVHTLEDCFEAEGMQICELSEHSHTAECRIDPETLIDGIPLEPEYFYEDESLSLTVQVEGVAHPIETESVENLSDEKIPDETPNEESGDVPQMIVFPLGEGDAEFAEISSSLDRQGMGAELVNLTALKLDFVYQDQVLDMSDCQVTVSIIPKEPILAAANQVMAELKKNAVPGTEIGVEIAMLQQAPEQMMQSDAVYLGETENEPAVMTLSAPLEESGVLAVATTQTANPKFTVQYYAYLDRIQLYDSEQALKIINTDNGGNNTGGNLPKNGAENRLSYLKLSSSNQPVTQQILTETYASCDYEYITAPSMAYFNRLYENGNYELIELWILKDGKSADSVNPADWDVYTNINDLHFTNREQSVVDGTILIEDNTVIRMVYRTSSGDFSNGVTFYDYDTTNGRIYATSSNASNEVNPLSSAAAGGSYYVKTDNSSGTDQQGINDESNYSGSGTKLAFGNNNTRVGLELKQWNGNTLNRFNELNRTYGGGSTFELVSGLENGRIKYSNGVIAPNLFNEGAATGKTQIDGRSLIFNRVGDTYTLSSILNDSGNTVIGNLHQFVGRTFDNGAKTIWSNDFWPMDWVHDYSNNYANGHDMKTGGSDTKTTAVGAPLKAGGSITEDYPASDDGIAHNNYFGMHYTVEFTLTEDYIGPLEYLFFGDDDMWVFLDDVLVCDIGGVHSSVGEYVNLWDWVEKGSSGTHTLSFFYTERGASGSSCYMHFTLPSVASITPEHNTGNLEIEKLVVGMDTDAEFAFDIRFTDADGNPMRDDYAYTRYDADGNIIMRDIIISDGGSFNLRANEYVIIKYLPIGTVYTISENEASSEGYLVNIEATGGIADGNSVTGRIIEGTIGAGFNEVSYTNSWFYELPQTGGSGVTLYTMAGLMLMLCSIAFLLYRYQKRRKEVQ